MTTHELKNRNERTDLMEKVSQMIIEYGPDAMTEMFRLLMNHSMRIERNEFLKASPWERTERRIGMANGYKDRNIKLPAGEIQVSIPQVRGMKFYPKSLERGSMSEKALKLAIAEMYIKGVSTRKVSQIVEQLCGISYVKKMEKKITEMVNIERNGQGMGESFVSRYIKNDIVTEKRLPIPQKFLQF